MYNSIYPINIKPYSGPKKGQIEKDKDKDSQQRHSQQQQRDSRDEKNKNKKENYNYFASGQSDNFEKSTNTVTTPTAKSFEPDKSNSGGVNIAQIMVDFKNTVAAINTPEDIEEEIYDYFRLIEKQSKNKEPNIRLIKSNLKNASLILDKYISDSLSKPSKVVENWIDTLFLQKIDFTYDEEKINPDFQLKFPEKKQKNEPANSSEEEKTEQKTDEKITVQNSDKENPPISFRPSDEVLKEIFIKAQKYKKHGNIQKSLEYYQRALKRAVALNDESTQSIIYYEVAKLFDKKDLSTSALKGYYLASKKASNNDIKTKAHYNMAKIYEDYIKTEPAMEHYFVALAYAGEDENYMAQSASLTNIASMYAEKMQKKEMKIYMGLAKEIVKETKNPKLIGGVYAKGATNYAAIGETKEALAHYKESTKQYKKIELATRMARNFEKSAELMLELGCLKKAKNLYRKAYEQYSITQDEASMQYVFERLAIISEAE